MLPDQLVEQWKGEVTKHFSPGAFSVFVYIGMEGQRYNALDPKKMAAFDIVVVPLRTLQGMSSKP